MERSQIHRVSVADQVAGILRQRILEGELRPGTPLPEIPLAASLSVSRNTMREAVRILALEGLLKRNIHRGVVVALSLKDVHEFISCGACWRSPPSSPPRANAPRSWRNCCPR